VRSRGKRWGDCIRRHVDALPPGYRSVVVLSEIEGLTNGEIAEALGGHASPESGDVAEMRREIRTLREEVQQPKATR
jgi:DNA-directed RNA polymerase specialized sigma24 family protein